MNKIIVIGGCSILLTIFAWFVFSKRTAVHCYINSFADVEQLFPQSASNIEQRVEQVKNAVQKQITALLAVVPNKRTYANTAQAYDTAVRTLLQLSGPLIIIKDVSPDKAVREAANKAIIELIKFSQDSLVRNKYVFEVFKAYVDGNARTEKLSDEQQYYLQEIMRAFKREGLNLPDAQLEHVKQIFNDITQISLQFDNNIREAISPITCTKAELDGVPAQIIDTLKRATDGTYVVGLDYPTVEGVLKHATVPATRKKVFEAFHNRAYPANYTLLAQLITKRHELAKLLGFPSYAAYDIDNEMAQTPQAVEQFLTEMQTKLIAKRNQEFIDFLKELPATVTLTPDGKLKPWDLAYVYEQYKQKHFKIDDNALTAYFPVDHVLKEVFALYQNFLGLRFEQLNNVHLWHDSVYAIEVRQTRNNILRGYLILDLYPRPNKYSHACELEAISAITINNHPCPAVVAIIANLPQGTAGNPGLLKFHDVETFFHEFGHAMHSILGSTHMCAFAGTATKLDFVEMPSQMFERWVQHPDVLKRLSRHYQTGNSLPDETITTLSKIGQLDAGYANLLVIGKGLLALQLFSQEKPGIHALYKKFLDMVAGDYVAWDDATHYPANFVHLTEYGSKYYSYLWAKVFAFDVFNEIDHKGGLVPQVGEKFVTDILSKGGSVDPNRLLKNFLGRAPNAQTFFELLGIETSKK